MSKKTRKKSSRTATKSTAAKAPRSGRAASAKSPVKATATKTRKAAPRSGKASGSAAAIASRKLPSKPPRSSTAAASKSTAPALVEGARAPAFDLPRDGGGRISSTDYAGKKLVLFFYPRADTPGCTREAIDFTQRKGEFAAVDTEVLGISADAVKAQDSFRNKHQLAVPLISDQQHEVLEAYGAWGEKSMYGRTFLGIIRTTVLIGTDGRIARIWRNVRVDGHADQVLAAARQL